MINPKGQSIIEVVIAAALISIGVVAALGLTNYSQKQNTFSQSLNEATAHNSTASEWLRRQRSLHGWAVLIDKLNTDSVGNTVSYCLDSLPDNFLTLSPGSCGNTEYIINTLFLRDLIIDKSNAASGQVAAEITTTWQEKTTRSTSLTLELTQWK